MVWVQLILLVVAIVLSIVLAPKPPQAKDPSINDISVPVATESDPIPVVSGKVWIRNAERCLVRGSFGPAYFLIGRQEMN